MPAVAVPSRNKAAVSLTLRPQWRWMVMNSAVPKGRAMKAKEKMVKAYSKPSRRPAKGKNTDGNTRTEAIP